MCLCYIHEPWMSIRVFSSEWIFRHGYYQDQVMDIAWTLQPGGLQQNWLHTHKKSSNILQYRLFTLGTRIVCLAFIRIISSHCKSTSSRFWRTFGAEKAFYEQPILSRVHFWVLWFKTRLGHLFSLLCFFPPAVSWIMLLDLTFSKILMKVRCGQTLTEIKGFLRSF